MVLVHLLVEIVNREEGKLGVSVGRDVVDEFKQGGEFAVDLGRNLVHCPTIILDDAEPAVPRHLFLCHI